MSDLPIENSKPTKKDIEVTDANALPLAVHFLAAIAAHLRSINDSLAAIAHNRHDS